MDKVNEIMYNRFILRFLAFILILEMLLEWEGVRYFLV